MKYISSFLRLMQQYIKAIIPFLQYISVEYIQLTESLKTV